MTLYAAGTFPGISIAGKAERDFVVAHFISTVPNQDDISAILGKS